MAIDWRKHEKAKYFNAKNLVGALDLTIAGVVEEMVGIGAEAEEKVVVYAREDERGVVLNVSRREALRDLFGHDTDKWIGRRFRLAPGRATFQGKAVKALFVEAVPGVGQSASRPQQMPAPPFGDVPPPDADDWEVHE
jgi:hypothetical protein